ncbi:hypothetical protein WBJ53_17690 [Spirosoma sp. SC4-14]|uniref:hypothetical protein n=1 Tax=Spirosoma sp. SC4-14 TaxID=3128900 RepID=UPI0030CB2AB9
MRFIGFIKEHDSIKESKDFQEYQTDSEDAKSFINQIIGHLDKGVIIFGWMGYAYDLIDQTPIAPHAYYTDGVLIWPSYLKYYLLKYPTFDLDQLTTRQILNQVDESVMINSDRLSEMEKTLGEKLHSAS